MSSDMDNTDTVKIFYEDTIANKVKVLGPDVNASQVPLRAGRPQTIALRPAGRSKGTGEQAVNNEILARARRRAVQGSVRFLPALRQADGQSPCHQALIRAGAFDTIAPHAGARRIRHNAAGHGRHRHGFCRAGGDAMRCKPACSTSADVAEEHAPEYVAFVRGMKGRS